MVTAKLNIVDRAIGVFFPGWMNKRAAHRLNMANAQGAGYITPGSPRKSMKGFRASANSPDRDTSGKQKGSIAASRDMYYNTALATAAVRRFRTNVVGPGLQPQPSINTKTLGISAEQGATWEKIFREDFGTWADSSLADFTNRLNFWELQAQAVMTVLLSGDCFALLPWEKSERTDWNFELRVRLVEADLVRNPVQLPDGLQPFHTKDILNGIELNKKGQWIATHFWSHYSNEIGLGVSEKINTFDETGRQQVFQLYLPERIGQRRGMPFIAPIVDDLKSISRLTTYALQKQIVNSLFTVFVKDMRALGTTLNEGYTPEETATGGGTAVDSEGNQEQQPKPEENGLDLEMGPANIIYLDDDKEIQFADPKGTDEGFEPFYVAMVRQIAAAIEIPYEQLLLEFRTSYSSARAALLEAWKFYKMRRKWLVRSFCQPVYEAFLEEGVLRGRYNLPGFMEDAVIRRAWARSLWIGPGNGQIDPLREAKAAALKIQQNTSTWEEEYIADKGGDWEAAMDRKEAQQKIINDKDLNPYTKAPEELTGPTGLQEPEEPSEDA